MFLTQDTCVGVCNKQAVTHMKRQTVTFLCYPQRLEIQIAEVSHEEKYLTFLDNSLIL